MKELSKQVAGKKAYEKPMLRTIELAAEEVLAVGCKISSAGSAIGGGPTCLTRHCAGPGS